MLLEPQDVQLFFKLHSIRRSRNEDFKDAKTRHGIVVSLPMSGEPLPAKAPKARQVPMPASKEEKDQVLQVVIGLIDRFCKEHLDEEYAAMCRKLAEKLGRKRHRRCSRAARMPGPAASCGRWVSQLPERQEPEALYAVH